MNKEATTMMWTIPLWRSLIDQSKQLCNLQLPIENASTLWYLSKALEEMSRLLGHLMWQANTVR